MRIFKPKFKDKGTGETRECKFYYLLFTDNQQIKRRLSLGTNNKRAAARIEEGVQQLLDSGGVLKPTLRDWFNNLPEKIRAKLFEWGIVDDRQQRTLDNLKRPLAEHIEDFCRELEIKNSVRYGRQARYALTQIIEGCDFKTYGDIDANKVYTFLGGLQKGENGIGERTFNRDLKTAKQFCRWLVERGSAPSNPLACLKSQKQTQFRHKRRALTIDEQRKLLEVTASSPAHHNLTGYERSLVYLLTLRTGLRVNEIRNLTAGDFDFNTGVVTVQAAYTKNKKTACLVLMPTLAVQLKQYFADKLPNMKAFRLPNQPAKMIQKDLKAAGIDYQDAAGRFADFHSLRHSFITNLANNGVHPADAKELARHSTITLTMDYYTHRQRKSQDEIMRSQPDLLITDKKCLSCA